MNRKPPVISSSGGRKGPEPKRSVQQTPEPRNPERAESGQLDAERPSASQPNVEQSVQGQRITAQRTDAPATTGGKVKAGRPTKKNTAQKNTAKKKKLAVKTPPSASVSTPVSAVADAKPVIAFPDRKERDRRRGRRPWVPWTIAGGTLAVVALILILVIFSPVLALKKITVDGLTLASEEQVQAALAPLQGKPLTQITQAEVRQLVSSMPQVDSVSIEARPPSTLLVHVLERVPVAVLKNGDQYALVDPQGVILGTAPDPAAAQLPLIDGAGLQPESDQRSRDIFSAITAVLAALPQDVRAQMASATASSPDAVELALNNGKKAIWGDASQMALKAKALKALIDNPPASQQGKPEQPVQVYDVSSPQRPVTR
ncbi:cell division protein FtsQ/DivIB [Acaricomes phytoseiuli]|uniref:cell division protein FtsQ/DivIB n=1 Tax=Acaricomes phytoseiuli TaxID=291968 RepID=UPI000363AC39|nr:FtsQ-type POTRA domain-containing protein [Acaricomes phytoseiuli]